VYTDERNGDSKLTLPTVAEVSEDMTVSSNVEELGATRILSSMNFTVDPDCRSIAPEEVTKGTRD
jgi:hypothetical protein